MPKIYSDEEKKEIVRKLKKEANDLMQEKGVKHTTVDELVRRTGIPKGTFYLFYPSKEMLLFEVSQDYHEQVDKFIWEGMEKIMLKRHIVPDENADFSDCVDDITDVILGAMEITFSSCLKVVLMPDAMQLILSKIPDEVLEKHRHDDEGIGKGMFAVMAVKKGIDIQALVGSFMQIIFGGMYKREIGEDNWLESMRLLIKGLVLQMVGR